MKKWSGKFVLNYQTFNHDTFQKYLKIMLFFLKNLLQLLTGARFNTEFIVFQQQNKLFKWIDKRCKFVHCILWKDKASLCLIT